MTKQYLLKYSFRSSPRLQFGMQKAITFLFITICFLGQIQSQSMLEVGKQWVFEDMHYSNIWFPYSDTTIETITITADTIINFQIYKKLVLSYHPSCWNTGDVEYLREEDEKIFRLSRNLDQEFLMIDFGEEAGYEMLFDNGAGVVDTGSVIIDSFGFEYAFDGTLLEVQYMRILNNQSYDDDTPYKVYKDIGFLYPGFLFPDLGTGLCDFQDGIILRCVAFENDTIHFTEFDCFELQIINNIRQVHPEMVTLSPNPTTDYMTIPSGLVFLDLIDIYGAIYKPDSDSNRVYLNNFPEGIYLARFNDPTESKIYIGRIVKPN